MNASLLSQTYLQKLTVFKNIVFKIGQLNVKISDGFLLADLRRGIKQKQEKKLNSKQQTRGTARMFLLQQFELDMGRNIQQHH